MTLEYTGIRILCDRCKAVCPVGQFGKWATVNHPMHLYDGQSQFNQLTHHFCPDCAEKLRCPDCGRVNYYAEDASCLECGFYGLKSRERA